MADTLVENNICAACGAEVRPGSLFCYNCGGAVSDELPDKPAKKKREKAVSDAWLRGDLAENNDLKTTQLDDEVLENQVVAPTDKLSEEKVIEKVADKPLEKKSLQQEAKLKSAANMRRKAKTFQQKKVEIIWEEHQNAPNIWFLMVAVILILFVIGIFYMAMYLK
jgi:hypothetical protein